MTSDHLRAATSTGRLLHKDDPIEAWAEAVERIQAARIAQGHEPEPNLTAESLRAQTMLADDIIDEIVANENAVKYALERHGFMFRNTGGNCTAFVRVLDDGSEIWVTSDTDACIPDSFDEPMLASLMPMGPEGHPECEQSHEWRGALRAYVAMLDEGKTPTMRPVGIPTSPFPSDLVVGARVRLRRDVERYPHFIAAEGLTGIVKEVNEYEIYIHMDHTIVGCEEWDNDLMWEAHDHEIYEAVEVVGGAS